MFPFYFFSFLGSCILGFWAWYRILSHKSYRVMLVCSGICLILFGVFCIQDAQDVKLLAEQVSEARNDPTYYDDPVHRRDSTYYANFYANELERFKHYQWNSTNPDWKDPQNMQNAADILQNVFFRGLTPEKYIDNAESPDLVALKEDPVANLGKLFEIVGWQVHIDKCEDPEISSKFILDDTQYELMWLECSFTNKSPRTIDFILLEPHLKTNTQRFEQPYDLAYGSYAIFIGMNENQLPVFLCQ